AQRWPDEPGDGAHEEEHRAAEIIEDVEHRIEERIDEADEAALLRPIDELFGLCHHGVTIALPAAVDEARGGYGAGARTKTGTVRAAPPTVPSPSWPSAPLPQQRTSPPSAVAAHACSAPAATDTPLNPIVAPGRTTLSGSGCAVVSGGPPRPSS